MMLQANTIFTFFALFLFHIIRLVIAVPVPAPGDNSGIVIRASGSISQSLYNDLERYAKFSSAAYQFICLRPLGTTVVKKLDKKGTQGFIARDDSRKEIIVSIRGTFSIGDAIVDLILVMTPLKSVGITDTGGAFAHTGFQFAANAVVDEVISTLRAQLASRPDYKVVITGHSLGGAVAGLLALSVKASKPNINLKLYTYGQPRVGNAAYAQLTDNRLGPENIFRTTHTWDGVPTVLPKELGYRHFGIEYWNYADPSRASNTKRCNGAEDQSCSDSIPSTFINPPHLVYFGQAMALNPLLCLF